MNKDLEQHLSAIGKKATDKLNRFEGVVDNITFDLYGSIKYRIQSNKGGSSVGPVDASRITLAEREQEFKYDTDTILEALKGLGKMTSVVNKEETGYLILVSISLSGELVGEIEYTDENEETKVYTFPINGMTFEGESVIKPPKFHKDGPIAKGKTGSVTHTTTEFI